VNHSGRPVAGLLRSTPQHVAEQGFQTTQAEQGQAEQGHSRGSFEQRRPTTIQGRSQGVGDQGCWSLAR